MVIREVIVAANGERRSETLPGAETEVDDAGTPVSRQVRLLHHRGSAASALPPSGGVDTGHGPSTNCTLQSSPVAIVTLG